MSYSTALQGYSEMSLYVSYAVPINRLGVSSDTLDSHLDPSNRWIGEAVAGNFGKDSISSSSDKGSTTSTTDDSFTASGPSTGHLHILHEDGRQGQLFLHRHRFLPEGGGRCHAGRSDQKESLQRFKQRQHPSIHRERGYQKER